MSVVLLFVESIGQPHVSFCRLLTLFCYPPILSFGLENTDYTSLANECHASASFCLSSTGTTDVPHAQLSNMDSEDQIQVHELL